MIKNLCSPLEAKDVKGFVHDLHLLDIVDGVHLDLAQAAGRIICGLNIPLSLSQSSKLFQTVDVVGELAQLVEVDHVGDEEVEHVVTSLAPGHHTFHWFEMIDFFRDLRRLVGHTGLLKQVGLDITTSHTAHVVEPHSDEFTKSGGVVVSHSLGVAVCLQHGVGLDDLVLKGGLLLLTLLHLLGAGAGADEGKIGDDLLGVLSLSSSRLTSNQDGLILTF